MLDDLQHGLGMLNSLFGGMPPAVFAIVSLGLSCLTLYVGWRARRSALIVLAVARVPLTDLRTHTVGLMKLRGAAHPPPARDGAGPSPVVWYYRRTRSGSGSSTLATTGHFLIRDAYGVCAVDSGKADVVPTSSESSHAFLDTSRTTVEKVIHTGDSVFAIGELRRGLAPTDLAGATCQLVRSGGVLLVSGSPERDVKVLYGLWFAVQAPLTLLFLVLLTFGGWSHITSYPPHEGSSLAAFFESLRTDPWQSDPGLERQLRGDAARQPAGAQSGPERDNSGADK